MVLKTIVELNEYIEATGVVYNHSNTKLISRKSKVKRSRREAFLSVLPYGRLSSNHHAEDKPLTTPKSMNKSLKESATSKMRQKLQVSVWSQLPHEPKTLDFELYPQTSVSSLKELIHQRIGVLPQRQHLYIGRNVPLLDFLTLHENGVDKKEIISLSTDDLTPDGPKVTCQPRDEVKRTQAQKPDEMRSEKEQSGATPQEEEKMGKTQADDGATPQEEEKVGKTDAHDGATPQEEDKVGKKQADDGATPQEEQKVGKTQADDGATPQEEQKVGKTEADDGATPQEEQKVGKTEADDGATPQEEQKVGKTQADDGATPQEEEEDGKTQAYGEDKPLTIWCMKGNLQIFVQYPVLHGQKILCLQLHKEIPVSSLKEMIHKRIGVKPKLQHLHIRRNTHNFQLQDLLTLNDCGVQQDETILLRLSTGGLLGGGPTGELPDETLSGISEKIPAQKLMKLGIELDFRRSEITKIDGTKRCPADKFFELLIRWRNKQPGDVNQTEALCKALKEVGETGLADDLAGGASLQSGQPSGDMSENKSSTSQQPTTQTAVSHSLTPVGTHASLQSGQTSVDMPVNQPSTSQQLTTQGAVSYSLFTVNSTVNIQTNVVRNGMIDESFTDLLLKSLKTYVYEKACHFFKTFGELLRVTFRSVVFVVRISSRASLEKLWTMYTSGELAKKLTEIFITDELTTEDKTDLSIQVTIQESDYVRACRSFGELQRASYEDLTCSTSDVQSQDISKKEEMRGNVKRYFSDVAKGLLERIESSENLSTLAESPVLLPWMCSLWREDSALPKTMSWLYQRVIKYMGKEEDVSKEEMSRVLIALGKVGLIGLLSPDQELTFKKSDFEQSVLDIDVGVKVGILTTLSNSVQFIHKTFQEFSAAAYLQSMLQANTEEFHNTLNEIMSKDPLAFEYLLRFCCGDNEACTLEILKVFQERHQKDLSFDNKVGHLALHCYFEGQCKCLPPKEFIHSFLTDHIAIQNLNDDSGNSVRYFVQRIAKETRDSGRAYLADVKSVDISLEYVHISHIVEVFSGLPNLVKLKLSNCRLCGTAVSWCKQLGQCKALQDLDLRDCSLNGQDMEHVAESLRGLPYLVTLSLNKNDLGIAAASWCKQLGQCKALQDLDLSDCSLNGQDMVHVAESLSGLPNLVRLMLSWNDLGGTAALWCKQLGQCKALQDLDLSECSLNGQDMVHVAESLSGLPNLVTLNLCGTDLGGTAESLCKQLGQCKALKDLDLSECSLNGQDMVHVAESLTGLPNLVRLDLYFNILGGTAALWCKQLGQCEALQDLDLSECSLNGQDMVHVVELLRGLPNLVKLGLHGNNLDGTAVSWGKQLGQCKALQDLNLSDCKLNGQDMVHVAESLRGLPNLVKLNLSWNDLGGTAASWGKQLGQFKALEDLDLSDCSLNGQDMVHVAESLRGLPKLVKLDLTENDLGGVAALFCAELKKFKALKYLTLGDREVTEKEKRHINELLAETNVEVNYQ